MGLLCVSLRSRQRSGEPPHLHTWTTSVPVAACPPARPAPVHVPPRFSTVASPHTLSPRRHSSSPSPNSWTTISSPCAGGTPFLDAHRHATLSPSTSALYSKGLSVASARCPHLPSCPNQARCPHHYSPAALTKVPDDPHGLDPRALTSRCSLACPLSPLRGVSAPRHIHCGFRTQ